MAKKKQKPTAIALEGGWEVNGEFISHEQVEAIMKKLHEQAVRESGNSIAVSKLTPHLVTRRRTPPAKAAQ